LTIQSKKFEECIPAILTAKSIVSFRTRRIIRRKSAIRKIPKTPNTIKTLDGLFVQGELAGEKREEEKPRRLKTTEDNVDY